jgi:tetratricopeptide (TPR) repeat protein
VFAWSFYSQGTRQQSAHSSDVFLKAALTFFGDPEMAGSAQGAFDKGRRLAQIVGELRALLILDGLEPLQYAPTSPTPGELKDQGLAALLKELAASNRGLCVVTTRYSLPALRAYWQSTATEVKLTRMSKEAGMELLRLLGVKGSVKEFAALVEEVRGHALTLNLLGTYLRDAHAGDIRKRDLVHLDEADAQQWGGHAFRVMDAYLQSFYNDRERGKLALAVLRLLGLFDRPMTNDCLAALLKAPVIPGLSEALFTVGKKWLGLNRNYYPIEASKLNITITRLEAAKLLTVNRDAVGSLVSLDAHPLLREYFARHVREHQPEAWRTAHRRLYEHLCATTKEGDQPTLEDLQPLYQAVGHGCQAGLQQETCEKVYSARILRGQEYYSTRKLGAFSSNIGAVAWFFESPWNRISSEITASRQSWLLNEAAFYLRALGRLTEALEPMRAALEMRNRQEVWHQAAISASNLSELELALGEVSAAVKDAKLSVTYADRSGDAFHRVSKRTTHADALHQAGRRAEAKVRFDEAEEVQAKIQPAYPLLYSVSGFQYCDLLLAPSERTSWDVICSGVLRPSEEIIAHRATLSYIYKRTIETLKWATGRLGLLTIALDHLTLGRVALYEAILERTSLDACRVFLQQAVDGLRRAGQQQELPGGLLSRAWLRSLTGPRTGPESAQADLDEAWEIAERGPMPLFLADIHLYRARLFFREEHYPWESPRADLAEARRLIEKCGYWRRKEELEDAEAAIRDWKRA